MTVPRWTVYRQHLYSPPMFVFNATILLSFANDGLFTVIRDPSELLEMQIEATVHYN